MTRNICVNNALIPAIPVHIPMHHHFDYYFVPTYYLPERGYRNQILLSVSFENLSKEVCALGLPATSSS
jgi:hypothetical protein